MTDLLQAHGAARAIAASVLGRDPGPMATAQSSSHHVYVGDEIVVKIIEADGHTRLDRETALAPHLPSGLTARLLDAGLHRLGTRHVRYACYARVPGAVLGMGLPGVDAATARSSAEEAVRQLDRLHAWLPGSDSERVLSEPLDHGGFTTRTALFAELERIAALDRHGTVPRPLLAGLAAIARRAPTGGARAVVPVHADCHWGNWLVRGAGVAVLVDFEWARFGEPADDWFFLIRFSGPHLDAVLDVVASATGAVPEDLRAECEVREAAHLASDLRIALGQPDTRRRLSTERLRALDDLVTGRTWHASRPS
ncbi:Phosphotransferase enzyme family protein [Streptomyces sp. YIM 130001]|uniref:phosphotransferase n=1 Tax=Streptomyces sp. YIM 130001 TaxID=2259644 RepID=UPI000E64EB23|nr:phosphotransferase [Streptomyces sp. YIM 130001]RII09140.1 Phosphotransferase enzyme family protein [Streptomyces sp. YIM 130001]